MKCSLLNRCISKNLNRHNASCLPTLPHCSTAMILKQQYVHCRDAAWDKHFSFTYTHKIKVHSATMYLHSAVWTTKKILLKMLKYKWHIMFVLHTASKDFVDETSNNKCKFFLFMVSIHPYAVLIWQRIFKSNRFS